MRVSGFLSFGVVLWACAGLGGTELAFDGGTCRPQADGSFALTLGGREVTLDGVYISKDWGFHRQKNCAAAEVKAGKLSVTFTPPPPPFEPLKGQPFTVRLIGRDDPQGLYCAGGTVGTFGQGQAWGWGTTFELMPHQTRVRWEKTASVSCWGGKSGDWNFRLPAPKSATVVFEKATVVLQKPVDIVAQKRVQYGRVLMPPQEKGFDPSLWRQALAASNATQETFGRIEDLFDARSRLYSAAERLSYKPERDAVGQRLVDVGYAALNKMELPAATKACEQLEARLGESESWMPYGVFNPFDWVKCFTQWGYRRAPDGCSVSEPNPWLLQWEDGFRFNLAQDARVVIARAKGEERFYETRYLKPMTDVSFERSWVATAWNLPDRRVTFSVLTPIVDVEGTDVLTLSGFSSEPRVLSAPNDRGQMSLVRLVESAPCTAEVVPSVLMDFTAPPPAAPSYSRGEQKIDAEHVIGPYLRLEGTDWALAFFPTARPISVKWEKGLLTLRFDRKGDVGVMRLRDNLSGSEQPAVCEFFAQTYLAYPTACRSSVKNGTARWRYAYRRRTNSWNTPPLEMAPVPPLLSFAGFRVSGDRRVKYPTKWGLYTAVAGETVTCPLPTDLPREPNLRGVNVSVHDSDETWEAHVTNGADWVRAFFSGSGSAEEQCAALEGKLKRFGARVRFLVDPHGCDYQVSWGGGMDLAAEDKFCALWDRISKVGARYPQVIEGYDLYNEPGLVGGGEARWRVLNERAAAIIRRNHPQAKVYFSAINGGNANGLFNLTPLGSACEPQTITYHFYSPHAFTHQKCATHNHGNDTCVFYPAWSAPIDWAAGNHFGGTTVDWFDRWTLAAILLPAYEHYAEFRKPLHVGEFGVIGYANGKSPRSAFLWTRDAVELFESQGASWHLWNGGFGLGNGYVREWMCGLWSRSRDW